MQKVTERFVIYRNAARSVWNTAFWPYEELRNWDSRDRFEEIKRILFEAIVLDERRSPSASRFLLAPKGEGVPILIEQPRPSDANRYWDAPVTTLKSGEATLEYVDFFDWDLLDCSDFRYYKAKIKEFAMHPELTGREALVEVVDVDIYLED